ncbi:MAG: hypothetical protein IPP17_30785 [Bacteroidetes bacterium]|nr:hypothetical protein [Bacteroidota bacterium]
MPAARLSTAFDSVTLYGEDPDYRPDIYGKIGNSGVSIASLDDAKRLYPGFDLCKPTTSVSMTINGPAAMLLAFYLNTAVDQHCESTFAKRVLEADVKAKIAAIYAEKGGLDRPYRAELPEGNDGLGLMLLGVTGDQCIARGRLCQDPRQCHEWHARHRSGRHSQRKTSPKHLHFLHRICLRMMGDIQQYFIDHAVRNFTASRSPAITLSKRGESHFQLTFTMANGFTFREYYLRSDIERIDDFASNLTAFFQRHGRRGTEIGRAQGASGRRRPRQTRRQGRGQLLKCFDIQTSGRSFFAQESPSTRSARPCRQHAIYDNRNSAAQPRLRRGDHDVRPKTGAADDGHPD